VEERPFRAASRAGRQRGFSPRVLLTLLRSLSTNPSLVSRAVILSEAKDPIHIRTLSAVAGNSLCALVLLTMRKLSARHLRHVAEALSLDLVILSKAKHPALRLRGRAALQGRVRALMSAGR
jgi:hypothetical protein